MRRCSTSALARAIEDFVQVTLRNGSIAGIALDVGEAEEEVLDPELVTPVAR